MPRWELLRHRWALGRYSHLRRWEILIGLGLVLHELPNWSIPSKRRLDKLHELPHRHLPWYDWCVVFSSLCALHIRELLRHNGPLGRYGHMRCWTIFGSLCNCVHELPGRAISS